MSDPLFDFNHLDQIAEGDEVFRAELIEAYLEDTARLVAELEGQFLRKDFEAAAVSAHSIKGASANLGALQVRNAAAELEQTIRNKLSLAQADSLLCALKAAFLATRPLLEQSLGDNSRSV